MTPTTTPASAPSPARPYGGEALPPGAPAIPLLIALFALMTPLLAYRGTLPVPGQATWQRGAVSAAAAAGVDLTPGGLWVQSCAACHGRDGGGVPGRGPDLQASAFLRKVQDDRVVEWLRGDGRAAHAELAGASDEQLRALVTHARTLWW